jgi:hypothetical protein
MWLMIFEFLDKISEIPQLTSSRIDFQSVSSRFIRRVQLNVCNDKQ